MLRQKSKGTSSEHQSHRLAESSIMFPYLFVVRKMSSESCEPLIVNQATHHLSTLNITQLV